MIPAMRPMPGKARPSLSACRPMTWSTAQSVADSFAVAAMAGIRAKVALTVAMFNVLSVRIGDSEIGPDDVRHSHLDSDDEIQALGQGVGRDLAGMALVVVGEYGDALDA